MIHTHQALWEAVATGLARPFLGGKPTLVQPASAGYYGEAEELGRTRGAPLLAPGDPGQHGVRGDLGGDRARVAGARRRRRADHRAWPAASTPRRSARATARSRPNCSPARASIFTGRLHPQKNLPLLLEAWTEVAPHAPANLILVGPGNDRQPLIELASSLGIADRVQFVGAVDNPADYLRAADVFVLPSVAEGMSNSLLEAMATALPCVVSGIGGNTDLIADGQTGRLVTEPTAEAWSERLLELLENPAEARRLGTAARERIDREFAHGVVVDRYVELYRRMIAGDWP